MQTVTEEKHEKPTRNWETVINTAMKFGLEISLKKKTWRIQEDLKAPCKEVVQTLQRSLFWKLLLKKTTENTNIAENALYKSDNIPRKF